MSQNDFTIDNQSFPATRADINSAIQALATLSSGSTAPSTPFPNQFWMDTTTDPYVLKIRNSSNNQWIFVAEVNQGSVYFAITAYLFANSGTVTDPSITFSGDRDTGLYSPAANTIGITTNGTLRYQIGPSGQFGIGSDYGTAGYALTSGGPSGTMAWASVLSPSGAITQFAGSSAPSGWLLCSGAAVSRTTYAGLFSVIGTTYGVGDGSTTFNIPDLRGRVAAGIDNMGGTAVNRITSGGSGISGTTLGATGGAETHTLTTGQMPAHTHDVSTGTSSGACGTTRVLRGNTSTAGSQAGAAITTGGGGAHNNTQPTIMLNYIIKT